MSHGEAEHVLHGFGLGNVLPLLPDDHGELHFPVELLEIDSFLINVVNFRQGSQKVEVSVPLTS